MSGLAEEVRAVLEEAEQLLAELPPLDPDHEHIRRIVLEMNATLHRLVGAGDSSRESLLSTATTIASARVVIERARVR